MAVGSGPLENMVVSALSPHRLPDPAFWRGRRVFLTGHTGFKGAWLALMLHRLGAEVTGYALAAPTQPSLFEVARVAPLLHHTEADIRDLQSLQAAMSEARPQVVLHLAAQALVRASYDDPVGNFASNVMGTVHVCEAARHCTGLKALVCVTSDKCYANHEWDWAYRESDPLGGHDPYSASKACAELVAASWRSSFMQAVPGRRGPALATARAGNVIGGGDWAADRLVPDLLRAHASGQTLHLRNPGATRPWQHVLDALAGYLVLAERLVQDSESAAQAWNFGPDEHDVRPVSAIAAHLGRALGTPAVHAEVGAQPHEAGSLRLDSARARQRLGWRPVWTLDQALDRVAAWHLAWMDGQDMRAFSLRQIDEHLSR